MFKHRQESPQLGILYKKLSINSATKPEHFRHLHRQLAIKYILVYLPKFKVKNQPHFTFFPTIL